MNKIKIGILMGGRSQEREISLNTGRTIYDHLDMTYFIGIPLFQTADNRLFILPDRFLHRGKIADFEYKLTECAESICWTQLSSLIDLLFIAMHGKYAEDGTMQGLCEVLNIPYCGSKILGSALGMNKIVQKYMLSAAGVLVPPFHALSVHTLKKVVDYSLEQFLHWIQNIINPLVFPLVVKPHHEGSSLGIAVVFDPVTLHDAIKKACYINKKIEPVVIEHYIEGMEFSCILLSDQQGEFFALTPTEIVPETSFFDYEQKYMPGRAEKYTPARCASDDLCLIQEISIKTAKALQMKYFARIDGFLTKDKKVIITDPNSFCGMAPSSFPFMQAAHHNMNPTQFIHHIINTQLQEFSIDKKNELYAISVDMINKKKLRVAVLFGGACAERETSLDSGRNVIYKLSRQKYEVISLFVDSKFEIYEIDQKKLVCNSTAEITLLLKAEEKRSWTDLHLFADFIFIALHGGLGENGALQGMLESLRIPYNGSSVLASALCMDKYQTKIYAKARGFDTPRGFLLSLATLLIMDEIAFIHLLKEHEILFPLIMKPHDDGCSFGVKKVSSFIECHEVAIFLQKANKQFVLIEECIIGTEITVGIIGNDTPKALPPSQVVTVNDVLSVEEKFLPGAGENQTPALLSPAALGFIKSNVERLFLDFNCKGYSRIDCFYQHAEQSITGKERLIIIEINTLPALTPATCFFHQAAEIGMKPMELIDTIIQLGMEEHRGMENEKISNCTFEESALSK